MMGVWDCEIFVRCRAGDGSERPISSCGIKSLRNEYFEVSP